MKSKKQTGEQGAHERAEGGNTKWGEGGEGPKQCPWCSCSPEHPSQKGWA